MTGSPVHLKEGDHRGAFVFEADGERTAEMTYTIAGDDLAIVDHTWVSDALRGQGVGRQLLDALVAWARGSNMRLIATCPYASSVFAKDASLRDVLAE